MRPLMLRQHSAEVWELASPSDFRPNSVIVSGAVITPLRPVTTLRGGEAEWTLSTSTLDDICTSQWEAGGGSASHIDSLPHLPPTVSWLPYRGLQSSAEAASAAAAPPPLPLFFVCTAAAEALATAADNAAAATRTHCSICSSGGPREHAVSHVAYHVATLGGDVTTLGGDALCFFCGSSSDCTTSLVLSKGRKQVISSTCPFAPISFRVGVREKPSMSDPCTNVPVLCGLCHRYVWKYSAAYHYSNSHPLSELPALFCVSADELRAVEVVEKKRAKKLWSPVSRQQQQQQPLVSSLLAAPATAASAASAIIVVDDDADEAEDDESGGEEESGGDDDDDDSAAPAAAATAAGSKREREGGGGPVDGAAAGAKRKNRRTAQRPDRYED